MGNITPAQSISPNYAVTERTGNNAIDLVSIAVGFYRHHTMPLKSLVLSPNYYDLFVHGCEVLADKAGVPFDRHAELTFRGVLIEKGGLTQFDLVRPRFRTAEA